MELDAGLSGVLLSLISKFTLFASFLYRNALKLFF